MHEREPKPQPEGQPQNGSPNRRSDFRPFRSAKEPEGPGGPLRPLGPEPVSEGLSATPASSNPLSPGICGDIAPAEFRSDEPPHGEQRHSTFGWGLLPGEPPLPKRLPKGP